MGSNTEKKPWTNLQNLYKNLSKGIKSNNFAITKLEERLLNGEQKRKVQYCDSNIGTYPISPFNLKNQWYNHPQSTLKIVEFLMHSKDLMIIWCYWYKSRILIRQIINNLLCFISRFWTELKGIAFDHDFSYSFPLFSSLLKKRGKKKRRMY